MNAPALRCEVKGSVAAVLGDCAASMRGEIETADEFILAAEDTHAWSEYGEYLTQAEMRRAFRQAVTRT